MLPGTLIRGLQDGKTRAGHDLDRHPTYKLAGMVKCRRGHVSAGTREDNLFSAYEATAVGL